MAAIEAECAAELELKALRERVQRVWLEEPKLNLLSTPELQQCWADLDVIPTLQLLFSWYMAP